MYSQSGVKRYLATTALSGVFLPAALLGLLHNTAMAQSVQSSTSRIIPLEYVYQQNVDADNNPIFNQDGSPSMSFSRLGIWVGIGGGSAQRYLFDTGSDQFNAAIGGDADIKAVDGKYIKAYAYGDGTYGYTTRPVSFDDLSYYDKDGKKIVSLKGVHQAAQILDTLYTKDSPQLNDEKLSSDPVCVTSARVGDDPVKCFKPGELEPDDEYRRFHSDLDAHTKISNGQRFEENDTLAGTFGAGDFLYSESIPSSALPGMTSTGYIVSANGNSNYVAVGNDPLTPGCSPCVIVDLNPSLRAQFTSVVPWGSRDREGHVDHFPGDHGAAASTQFEGGYNLKYNDGKNVLAVDLPVLLDTGTPNDGTLTLDAVTYDKLLQDGVITPSKKDNPQEEPDRFEMSLSVEGLQREPVFLNQVEVIRDNSGDEGDGQIKFIAGLNFFLSQSVAYDLEKQTTAYTPYFVSANNFSTDAGDDNLSRITKEMGAQREQFSFDDHYQPIEDENGKPVTVTVGSFGAAGVISGSGSLTLDPYADVRMTNVNTYTGATTISKHAILTLAGPGSIERSEKVIANGFLDIREYGDANEYWGLDGVGDEAHIQSLAGSGQVALGDRTLVITSAQDEFSGVVNDWDPATNQSLGGQLTILGGVQSFSGANIYTGMTTIGQDGALLLTDTASLASPITAFGLFGNDGNVSGPTIVKSTGIAAGSGYYSGLTIGEGGTIAPGSVTSSNKDMSTLTVGGDFAQQAGSSYRVVASDSGAANRVAVKGAASIDADTKVILDRQSASGLAVGTQHVLLTAENRINGQYDGLAGDLYDDAPYLDFVLNQQSNAISLDITRSSIAFADVGETFNQKSTGAAVEGLAAGNQIYDSILYLSEAGSRNAFNQLSGEMHASIGSALLDDSRYIRDAATNRIRSAFEGVGSSNAPVTAYGPNGVENVQPSSDRAVFWGSAFGTWGSLASDGNAASVTRSIGGFLAGVDSPISEAWRAGLITGYSHGSYNVANRSSAGSSDNYHLGVYGGTRWGQIGFRTGAAYSWHHIDTHRGVNFPGFSDNLSSDYRAGTFQAFGELGYQIDAERTSFEPYANLAYVHLKTDGFNETGGAAALSSDKWTQDTTFSTLGLRTSTNIQLGSTSAVVRGGLGWRHAFGDRIPESMVAFEAGSAFAVKGAPIATDAAVLEAGLEMNLTERAVLGVSYQGQIASGAHEHGFNAKLNVQF